MTATSPYLNTKPRELVDYIRESELSGGVGGGLKQERLDALDFLRTRTMELIEQFKKRHEGKGSRVNLGWAIGALEDALQDVEGLAERLADEE